MVELAAKERCTGCAACAAVCMKRAIRMCADDEGFLVPTVDAVSCVSCGHCREVCPVLNRHEASASVNPSAFVIKATDEALRLSSTSGGVFSLLAHQILSNGGVVFGAVYDSDEGYVRHLAVSTEKDLARLRGAKYVQSDVGDTYAEVNACLKSRRAVLYSGTPCQIAALRASLEAMGWRDLSGLLTVEVVCNSVPSPLILKKWLEAASARGNSSQQLCFRDKASGWHSRTLLMRSDATSATLPATDAYYDLWQKGYTVRLSCRECLFRNLQSGADLTIGDAWGIESMSEAAAALDDGKGVSLVVVNTPQGSRMLKGLAGVSEGQEIAFAEAVRGNPAIVRSPEYLFTAGARRVRFWKALRKSDDIIKTAVDFTRPRWVARLRRSLGRILRKMGVRK